MEDLTDAYENGAYIPGAEAYRARWPVKAAAFRGTVRARLDLRYGTAARNRFDLFLPEAPPQGLLVFVHGGYWRVTSKDVWSHLAAGPVARGWAVAMPSYTLAPTARIRDITREVAAAVEAAAGEIDGALVIAGHSAGGHLSARMRCRGVLPDAVLTRVARIVPISPLSDLRPLLQTEMNADLNLDMAEACDESPALIGDLHDIDTHVWVGAEERPAFLDQARWLSDAWSARLTVAPGRHHFDVVEELETAESPLIDALLGGLT